MTRWAIVIAAILFTAGCAASNTTETTGTAPTTTAHSETSSTSPPTSTTVTTVAPASSKRSCTDYGEPEATVDISGDGIEDNIYMNQRDDGGYDLVVCGEDLQTSIDVGGQNKPPFYVGSYDIDGNGTQELFYSAATGHGVIYFAATLIDGVLQPVDYSWPVILESGDAATPLTGSSFSCSERGIAALTFEPAGTDVRVSSVTVTLQDGVVTTSPEDPIVLPADQAFALWRDHDSCFTRQAGLLIPMSEGWLERSGVGVAAGPERLMLTGDGGSTWSDVTPPRDPTWQEVTSASFLNGKVGYVILNDAAMQSQLVSTTDGGTTWTAVHEFAPLHHAGSTRTMHFFSPDVGWSYAFDPAASECPTLEQTTDGGHTWKSLNACLPQSGDIWFESDGLGWLGGTPFFDSGKEGSLHYTLNYGRDWQEVRAQLPEGRDPGFAIYGIPTLLGDHGLLAVALNDAPTVDIAVYTTDEQGVPVNLLRVIPTAIDTAELHSPPIVFVDEMTWWVASGTDEAATASVTTDGGATWQITDPANPPSPVLRIQALDNDTAWLTTREGLFITQDATTWDTVTSGS